MSPYREPDAARVAEQQEEELRRREQLRELSQLRKAMRIQTAALDAVAAVLKALVGP